MSWGKGRSNVGTILIYSNLQGSLRGDRHFCRNPPESDDRLANGGFAGNTGNLNATLGTDWHVAAIGDFNGDAIDDLLLRNSSGTVIDWLGQSNGTFTAGSLNTNLGTDWHVQEPFVHDPFGV